MNGILVINKPIGLTSHDCINRLRKHFNMKKIGHTGTLDPEASGVLVVGIGKATRLMQYLNQDDKAYHFDMALGIATDTLDHTGTITETMPVGNIDLLDDVLKGFKGLYRQIPPAYSAVKVQGKKLYEYARKKEIIPSVAPRDIDIYTLKRNGPLQVEPTQTIVSCYVDSSKGLYVRKLAEDIAYKLHTCAHTTRIHRVKAGQFTIDDAVDLSSTSAYEKHIINPAEALVEIPPIRADEAMIKRIASGQSLTIDSTSALVKCVDASNQLLAIYEKKDTVYKAKTVLI